MSFLWQTDFEKKTFYVEDCFFSPYMEIDNLRGMEIGVNPFLRFRDIFEPLLNNYIHTDDEYSSLNVIDKMERKEIENLLFQYLARLDSVRGKHRISLQENGVEHEILDGWYGCFVKQAFVKLSDYERNTIKAYLLLHHKRDGKVNYYREVVQSFFPGSILYIHSSDKKLLLYIPQNKRQENEEKLQMINTLFLHAGQEIDVYWNRHFGILGRDWSMQLNKLVLY